MYNNVRNDVTDYADGGSPKIWKSKSLKNEILFCLQKKKLSIFLRAIIWQKNSFLIAVTIKTEPCLRMIMLKDLPN